MSFLETLDPKYRLILCDVWGVVHDGVTLYPGASERLQYWRQHGRKVVLITNAPRTEEAVIQQLQRIGLPGDAYDFIATSGEAGIEGLMRLEAPVGFVGSAQDRAILEGRGVSIAGDDRFTDIACTGTMEGRPDPDDYRVDLQRWAGRGVTMHCLNPDRMVIRGGQPEACAGAIADLYLTLGGTVEWYGKPNAAIYRHALHRAGDPPRSEVLAIGDGLQTDILGAALMGYDALFITGGIHQSRPFPEDFATRNGLGQWKPVGIAESLA